MIILQKGQQNELVLNINNNSRQDFSGYTLTFTNSLSREVKSYVIPTTAPLYGENIRYCELILNLQNDDLNYEGQYELQIFGNGTNLVYTGLCRLEGTSENNTIVEYISTNDDNEQFIYIQD
jgi:hypothetical protein